MGKNHTNSQRSGRLRSAAHAPELFSLHEADKKPGTAEEAFPIESPIQSPIASAIKSKVLIVHHAPLVRSGLAGLIDASDRFTVCAQTGDAPRAREMFVEYQPHLVLLGLTLHRGNGIALIKHSERLNKTLRTHVLSAREDTFAIALAFRRGSTADWGIENEC